MERDERRHLRAVTEEVTGWTYQARTVLADRAKVHDAATAAVAALRRSVVEVRADNRVAWRVMLLCAKDDQLLRDIARAATLPRMSRGEEKILVGLTTDVLAATEDVRSVLGARRFFSGRHKRDLGGEAAEFLSDYRDWAVEERLPDLLDRASPKVGDAHVDVPVSDVLADRVGLGARVRNLGKSPEVLDARVVSELQLAVATIERALVEEARFRADVLRAGEAVRRAEVARLLREMPVERLKDATRDRLRVGPLTDAGIATVDEVLVRGTELEFLPGVGRTTATRMRGAAQTLWQTTYEEMPVRIDIKNRSVEATELLERLRAWDAMRKTKGATTDLKRAEELAPLAHALDSRVSHIVVFSVKRSIDDFRSSIEAVTQRARVLARAHGSSSRSASAWDDFISRPADYFAMLAELGFITEDEQKTHGDLPDEIVEAVRALELNTEYLSASLRGYQSFGARFALVQRKVIIGDEMGLGKTVEALAVLSHLRAHGSHHFLVVCPAAVVTNWIREVTAKSTLRAHRVHGLGRDAAVRSWVRGGGVAVSTFETLGWLEPHLAAVRDLGCVVIDEAHYIKSPAALRTQRAGRILDGCSRALMLTGTPLENRIEEFRSLVGYLRPELVVDVDGLAPRRFRRQVAPAYLRRNQEDVLTELPELVEVDEWLPMSDHDLSSYRDAVAAGNFMAMRQAAMVPARNSQKLQRLIEIVLEAEENGRRVIVFSHFRAVLDHVARALPGKVFGPLTGSVPAAARQLMVDQFSAAAHGAALVAQIVAGGVGLNIQAASIVVICEPQLKPTTEWQAIARARRMGQLESVQVHRLLSEEGVDRRITEVLARKRGLFDEFARISETADSAPEAFDISEAELARDVIAAERERLFAAKVGPADAGPGGA